MNQDQTLIIDILARHAQCAPADLDASCGLLDLGLDSLKFIVAVLDIEQRLNRRIFDVDNVGQLTTVGDILRLVAA
jgi:acyl carrier protein